MEPAAGLCEQLAQSGSHADSERSLQLRLLVVLAHPDDETLALGGRMDCLHQARFIVVTDGVPLDGLDARAHGFTSLPDYGRARQDELAAALRLANLNAGAAIALEVSPGVTVSDQCAARSMQHIAQALVPHILKFQPEAILTHPYEGGHPDHDACAFAVWAAARLAGFSGPILEAPFYHDENGTMATGRFLGGDPGIQAMLTPRQAQLKAELLACFASQAETLSLFPIETECFRNAPQYDFSKRPASGPLHYERFAWCMSGDKFCALALQSMRELEL